VIIRGVQGNGWNLYDDLKKKYTYLFHETQCSKQNSHLKLHPRENTNKDIKVY